MNTSSESLNDLLDRLVAEYADQVAAGGTPSREDVLARAPTAAKPGLERCLKMIDSGRTRLQPSHALVPGMRLARYELLREIGRGGLAIVWLARDVELARPVALKVLRPGLAVEARHVDRFRREALSVARLRHPHVVQVHEVGETQGCHWIAMEFFEGPSLARVLEAIPPGRHRTAEDLLGPLLEMVGHRRRRRRLRRGGRDLPGTLRRGRQAAWNLRRGRRPARRGGRRVHRQYPAGLHPPPPRDPGGVGTPSVPGPIRSKLGIRAEERSFVFDGENPTAPQPANKEPTMKALTPTVLLALALGAGGTLSSCQNFREKPGVDGTAYSFGHLDVLVRADPKRVVEAAEGVLRELDILVETAMASGLDGKVVGKTALSKKIEIIVERLDSETTKYSIQVGTFGDEALSREIYEKMKAKI